MKHDSPFFIAASLFVGAFALESFTEMFALPVSQMEMMGWISWILSLGAVIVFFSGLINHKHR
jgi:hypothetical protein